MLFTAYPQTRALLKAIGMPRRDLRPASGGAVFMAPGGPVRFAGDRAGAMRFGGLAVADRLRLARLAAQVVGASPEVLLAGEGHDVSTDEYLRARGFSEAAIEGFFRPFFGVVTLDRTLGADAAYFRFLLGMLARGPAAIPSDGLGMIAEWTLAAIRQAGGRAEFGVGVDALVAAPEGGRLTGVRLADGRVLEADAVVLAVDGPAAERLLRPVDPASADRVPSEWASSVSAAWALSRPLYRGRVIVVNAEGAADDPQRVDLLCQTTNITRPGAPDGPHIVLATRVLTGGGSAAGLEAAVAATVARWAPRFDWAGLAQPIGVYEHRHAQFRPLPGVRSGLPGPRGALANLVVAGDTTTHPSIEGAVTSGFRAAEAVVAGGS